MLFPAFERATGMRDIGPTAVMRMEHQQIHRTLDEIHQKVRVQDPDSDALEAQLISVLTQHNQKEENILYPGIDQMVSPELLAEILRKVREGAAELAQECCSCG